MNPEKQERKQMATNLFNLIHQIQKGSSTEMQLYLLNSC